MVGEEQAESERASFRPPDVAAASASRRLSIGQHQPRDISLADIEPRSTEPDQPLDFGLLIVWTEVDVKTVLAHLGLVVRNEQNPG